MPQTEEYILINQRGIASAPVSGEEALRLNELHGWAIATVLVKPDGSPSAWLEARG